MTSSSHPPHRTPSPQHPKPPHPALRTNRTPNSFPAVARIPASTCSYGKYGRTLCESKSYFARRNCSSQTAHRSTSAAAPPGIRSRTNASSSANSRCAVSRAASSTSPRNTRIFAPSPSSGPPSPGPPNSETPAAPAISSRPASRSSKHLLVRRIPTIVVRQVHLPPQPRGSPHNSSPAPSPADQSSTPPAHQPGCLHSPLRPINALPSPRAAPDNPPAAPSTHSHLPPQSSAHHPAPLRLKLMLSSVILSASARIRSRVASSLSTPTADTPAASAPCSTSSPHPPH